VKVTPKTRRLRIPQGSTGRVGIEAGSCTIPL
jgi:hypothetical protein